jgi:hypothetical protein
MGVRSRVDTGEINMRYAFGVILLLVVGSASATTIGVESCAPGTGGNYSVNICTQNHTIDYDDPWGNTTGVIGMVSQKWSGGVVINEFTDGDGMQHLFVNRTWRHNEALHVDEAIQGPELYTSIHLTAAGVASMTDVDSGEHPGAVFGGPHYDKVKLTVVVQQLNDKEIGSYTIFMTGAHVPVPAAVWLFGSALAGLGWLRRKQTA